MPTARQVVETAQSRLNEKTLLTYRNGQYLDEDFQAWKNRVAKVDEMYRGDFTVKLPDNTTRRVDPKVMNAVQVGLDDFARLSAETKPQIKVVAEEESADGTLAALVRQQVFAGYWKSNKGELKVPMFGYDLAGTGFSASALHADPDVSKYPIITRLDPRACYPRIVNDRLLDLIVLSRYYARDLEPLFGISPGEAGGLFGTNALDEVEVIDFYDAKQRLKVWAPVRQGKVSGDTAYVISAEDHGLGVVPVAWHKMPTFDSKFRGFFDQANGMLQAMNQIFYLMLEYSSQLVYNPFFAVDVENDTDPPGPRTIYRGRSADSKMMRIPPAGSQPQLFEFLQFLEGQIGTSITRPEQRGGAVSQSIASASFVSATLGAMTTTIKAIQTGIGSMREQMNDIGARIDCKELNERKPLLIPAGSVSNYTPDPTFKGDYRSEVVYGAGAGLDALNKKVALGQDVQMGIASTREAMRQTDYISDPDGMYQEIIYEQLDKVALQKFEMTAGITELADVKRLMRTGKTFDEAYEILGEMMAREKAAGVPTGEAQGQGGNVGQQGAPQNAQQLAQGGMPAQGGGASSQQEPIQFGNRLPIPR